MEINKLVVGKLFTNCYIVTKNNQTIIIDPGDEAAKIIKACQNKNVIGILITHNHFDHIGALKEIEKHFNLKRNNKIMTFNFEVIKTPGHTKDSVTYYFKEDKVMFTGDFIFKNSIGRMDLPSGSINDMQKSLAKISKYPKDIAIYPGHGEITTLEKEKVNFKYYFN